MVFHSFLTFVPASSEVFLLWKRVPSSSPPLFSPPLLPLLPSLSHPSGAQLFATLDNRSFFVAYWGCRLDATPMANSQGLQDAQSPKEVMPWSVCACGPSSNQGFPWLPVANLATSKLSLLTSYKRLMVRSSSNTTVPIHFLFLKNLEHHWQLCSFKCKSVRSTYFFRRLFLWSRLSQRASSQRCHRSSHGNGKHVGLWFCGPFFANWVHACVYFVFSIFVYTYLSYILFWFGSAGFVTAKGAKKLLQAFLPTKLTKPSSLQINKLINVVVTCTLNLTFDRQTFHSDFPVLLL